MKQKLTLIILLSLTIIVFTSCKKEKITLTTVDGTVANKLTGALVKNVPIYIIECQGYYETCDTTANKAFTDDKGYFKISFQVSSKKSYSVSVGLNDSVGYTAYPYKLNGSNDRLINFYQYPIKTLKLTVKVLRHNKNWLTVSAGNRDAYDYYFGSFYNDQNPVADFNNTYYTRIQAGREYAVIVELSNKTGTNSYTDRETFSKNFTMNNTDTTSVDFVVP